MSLDWVHEHAFDALECVTVNGRYRCVRNYCDVSVLYFNGERLGSFGSGSHEGSKIEAEKHHERLMKND